MEQIKEELTAQLENPTAFTIPIFGGIPVSQSVLVSWILIALLALAAFLMTRHLRQEKPGRVQLVLEWFVELINGMCKSNIGGHGRSFAPWLGTVALYIAVANMCGLVGLAPPTKNLSVPLALALTSVVLIYGAAFRFKGFKGGFRQFVEPVPVLLPINIMEIVIRPLSLCMRLFGNVLAAFVVMELVKLLVPAVLPAILSIYFDIFDGLIQTVVFVFLTALFIGEALEEA